MGDLVGLLYMSAVPTIISTFTYAFAIERIGPAQAGVFIHTVPLFSCLFAAVLAGEALHPYHAAGFLLVARITLVDGAAGAEPVVAVTRTAAAKCDRCWTFRDDVGHDATQPGLCTRCTTALAARR